MAIFPVFMAIIAGCMVLFGAYYLLSEDERVVAERLRRIAQSQPYSERDYELSMPFSDRVIKPMISGALDVIGRMTPKSVIESTRRKLNAAGNPWGMNPTQFIALKVFLTFILPGMILFIGLLGGAAAPGFMLGVMALLIGLILPELILTRKKNSRKKEMQKALPDILDLLTVSVEAGLGFDSALAKVIEKTKGPLSKEFEHLLREIRLGKPRRDAFRELGVKSPIEDLSTVMSALVQADQLGVSIGKILRIQSEQMRTKRRQRAEEAAMKAPIKMMIPMIFFIFPTLFIVLLGPAAIQMLLTFSNM